MKVSAAQQLGDFSCIFYNEEKGNMMSFGHETEFEIKIANGGEIVHSMRELIPVASKYLNEMKQE